MFNTSITGINGSQKYLDTTSNNIANANSYGFKKSRAEFADLYTNSVFTSSKTATGMGTNTTTVAQQFAQGSLSGDTGNNLDMAISGNGFFVLANEANDTATANNGDRTYTRNCAFELNPNGYVVTAMGDYLQGYPVNEDGNVANLDITSTKAIRIPSDTGAPRASSKIGITFNLPAGADAKATKAAHGYQNFDHTDSSTYTNASSQTIYDSLGGAHTLTYYFIKDHTNDGTDNNPDFDPKNPVKDGHTIWNVLTYVDGNPVDVAGGVDLKVDANSPSVDANTTFKGIQLEFGTDGKLVNNGQTPGVITFTNAGGANPPAQGRDAYTLAQAMGGGVDDSQSIVADLNYTQYGSSKFSVGGITNDGYSTGVLENVQVNEDGVMIASYTNGRTSKICKVAMANFTNPQGLIKVGDTQWKESVNSGEAQACEANSGMAGSIKGANLELSNVELASELVDLIIAQRTYQANAQALQTQNTAMDSIMNIR